jgi:hypothetical protein
MSRDFQDWNQEPSQVQAPRQAPPPIAKKLEREDRIHDRLKTILFWAVTLTACGFTFYWLFVAFQLLP